MSPKTIAPAYKCLYPVYLSLITAAVKPTPVEPLPVVEIESGAIFIICLSNWDFPVDGSPISKIFISPLKCVLLYNVFDTPPNNCKTQDCLTNFKP